MGYMLMGNVLETLLLILGTIAVFGPIGIFLRGREHNRTHDR